ncbi:hypothetical protein TNCT_50451 [Trichonephila clavata]|uniref:Uncharacterized protein n=1 Tax=Trichonephila clavata TaxID=2740835 RepID=A0A8X6IIY3_TRICU|nr:hypothetical protein TNCT_50451 [Trichonephila clavata]
MIVIIFFKLCHQDKRRALFTLNNGEMQLAYNNPITEIKANRTKTWGNSLKKNECNAEDDDIDIIDIDSMKIVSKKKGLDLMQRIQCHLHSMKEDISSHL